MNVIDRKFYELISIIKEMSTKDIYNNIKRSFDMIPEQTKLSLEDYFKRFDYWGKLELGSSNYEQLMNKAESLHDHINDYVWLYERLGDYRSKKLLYAILNNWYQYDFITLAASHEKNYSHYFDLDLIKTDNNDVFVDLGTYTGDTILDYISTFGTDGYKRIYGYEITKETFDILSNNVSSFENVIVRNKAILDTNGVVYINDNVTDSSANTTSEKGYLMTESTSLDIDITEPITIIKMDIEGGEQQALLGCKNHIVNDHPKLLLSVYHNNEDIWKIPRMIEEMCPNYKFYLRSHGGSIYPTEIVLIAVYN